MPPKRELDMLVTAGEQISASLLAMALEGMGMPVVSLLGWQMGMKTNSNYGNARIKKIESERLEAETQPQKHRGCCGFQGINKYDDITTLGRGGSDTTAVAIAAALKADACHIYTDVDGVYTADPRDCQKRQKARRNNLLTEMLGACHPSAPRCFTTVRWKWQRNIMLT